MPACKGRRRTPPLRCGSVFNPGAQRSFTEVREDRPGSGANRCGAGAQIAVPVPHPGRQYGRIAAEPARVQNRVGPARDFSVRPWDLLSIQEFRSLLAPSYLAGAFSMEEVHRCERDHSINRQYGLRFSNQGNDRTLAGGATVQRPDPCQPSNRRAASTLQPRRSRSFHAIADGAAVLVPHRLPSPSSPASDWCRETTRYSASIDSSRRTEVAESLARAGRKDSLIISDSATRIGGAWLGSRRQNASGRTPNGDLLGSGGRQNPVMAREMKAAHSRRTEGPAGTALAPCLLHLPVTGQPRLRRLQWVKGEGTLSKPLLLMLWHGSRWATSGR